MAELNQVRAKIFSVVKPKSWGVFCMNPKDSLKLLLNVEKEFRKAKRSSVDVGLIADKVGSKIYGDGMTVLQVGYIHEYGRGNNPKRSFLRTPFNIKQKKLRKFIQSEFEKLTDGRQTTEKALGRIGAYATNISKMAFRTQGYGTWAPDKPETIKRKGSSQPLIDTGTLRNSITWLVNNG